MSDSKNEQSNSHPMRQQQSAVNPKTGRLEVVFVDLEQVYPNTDDPLAVENSFEELRARHRGWLKYDWAAIRREKEAKLNKAVEASPVSKPLKPKSVPLAPKKLVEQAAKPQTVPLKGIEDNLILNDENQPPSAAEMEKAKAAKKARREERANRTRKIKVMEVREIRGETQTSIAPCPTEFGCREN